MNKDGFGASLLESGELMKRSYTAIVGSIGKLTALITLIAAALVTFTEVGFYELGAQSLTSTAIVMLIATYLIYFSMVDAGERLGEGSEVFLESEKRYKAATERVRPERMGKLREFLEAYTEEELEYRRRSTMLSFGVSSEEYELFVRTGECAKKKRRALVRITKMKPVTLSPEMLLERDKARSRTELQDPTRVKLLRLSARLIPTTLCTLFTASIMLTAKEGITREMLIEGIFKLCALPIVGFKGYSAGYVFAKDTKRAWIDVKTRLLEAFLASGEKKV